MKISVDHDEFMNMMLDVSFNLQEKNAKLAWKILKDYYEKEIKPARQTKLDI